MGLCLTLKRDESIYLWTGVNQDVDELVVMSLNGSSREKGYDLSILRPGKQPYRLKTTRETCKDPLLFMSNDIVSRVQMKTVSTDKLKLILDAEDGIHILHKKEAYDGNFVPPEWKCSSVKMAE